MLWYINRYKKKNIEFEPSASYLQKQNKLSKKKNQTLVEHVRSTIIRGVISDKF